MGLHGKAFVFIMALVFFVSCRLTGDKNGSQSEQPKLFTELEEKLKDKPGIAILVMEKGETLFSGGFGFGNLEEKEKMTDGSLIRYGSNIKPLTSVLMLKLEEEGKLSTRDLLSKYIPEIPKHMKNVKIYHLMRHTSGLPDVESLCGPVEEGRYLNFEDVINYLNTLKSLKSPPGENYEYSSTGYLLLAEVIRRASKASYVQEIQNSIFNPLDMTNSFVANTLESQNRINTTSYKDLSDLTVFPKDRCDLFYGDRGLVSNMNDFAKFIRGLEEYKIVSKDTVEKVKAYGGLVNNSDKVRYAFGDYRYRGEKVLTHGGYWGGYQSFIFAFPEKKRWVVLVANSLGHDLLEYSKKISDHYFFSIDGSH